MEHDITKVSSCDLPTSNLDALDAHGIKVHHAKVKFMEKGTWRKVINHVTCSDISRVLKESSDWFGLVCFLCKFHGQFIMALSLFRHVHREQKTPILQVQCAPFALE